MCYIKIYKTKMPNAKKTLDYPVDVNTVYSHITDSKLKETFEKLLIYKNLYFWDFGIRETRKLNSEAKVVIICGKSRYEFEVVEIIPDLHGKIGDILGWSRQYKAPWKNVCALKSFT